MVLLPHSGTLAAVALLRKPLYVADVVNSRNVMRIFFVSQRIRCGQHLCRLILSDNVSE
jgi:hypothetical protein